MDDPLDTNQIMEVTEGNQIKQWIMPVKKPGQIFTDRMLHAKIFIDKQPIFFDSAGIWWAWDLKRSYWKIVDEIDILNLVTEKTPLDTVNSKVRAEILNALKQEGRLQVPQIPDPKIIQFKNGLVHIDNPNEIIVPNPTYFVTNPLPYDLGKTEDTPIIDNIIEEWVGKEFKETLYEIMSYCMFPDYFIKRIFFFVGGGDNGKSTFFRLLEEFLSSKNIVTTELTLLSNNRFEVFKLLKKNAALISETDEKQLNSTLWLKKLSGNDPIDFEKKYATNTIHERSYAKLLVSTNFLPEPATDESDAWYSRALIVPFKNVFDGKTDILAKIPKQEYENLGRKLINILKTLIEKRSFSNEGNKEDRRERYMEQADPMTRFLREFVEEDLSCYVWKAEFARRFKEWCEEKKFKVMSEDTIGLRMKKKGHEGGRRSYEMFKDGKQGQGRVWEGIKWRK